jgi:hypothetical protein
MRMCDNARPITTKNAAESTTLHPVDRYMIYDADYQLSHQMEKCNEYPRTLVCPLLIIADFYDILLRSKLI